MAIKPHSLAGRPDKPSSGTLPSAFTLARAHTPVKPKNGASYVLVYNSILHLRPFQGEGQANAPNKYNIHLLYVEDYLSLS